jgi:hypothetical protein
MDKYYYLAAQLPFLKFGQKPEITRDYFLTESAKWLKGNDFLVLSGVDINDFYHAYKFSGLLRDYKQFEKELREELRVIREAGGKVRGYKISDEIKNALAGENPLEVEKKFLYLRWKFIEEKESGHYSDLNFLIAYFLKIQILDRMFTFDKDKGMAEFDKICETKIEEKKDSI